jgi:signal peptidase I
MNINTVNSEIRDKSTKSTKRNVFITIILSMLQPGLGHIYLGKFKMGVLLYFLINMLGLIIIFTGLIETFTGLSIILIVSLIISFAVIIHSIFLYKNNKQIKSKSYSKWYFYLFILVLMFIIDKGIYKIFKFYYQPSKVASISMENAVLSGDWILCDNFYYNKHNVVRNDIVVFEPKGSSKKTISRVIGLPGDTVEIVNKNIFINNTKLEQPYTKYIDDQVIPSTIENVRFKIIWEENEVRKFMGTRDNFNKFVVPENSFFVMGDNRDVSKDSRYLGCIQRNKILGKPSYIYYSYGKEPFTNIKDLRIDYRNPEVNNRDEKIRRSRIGKTIK